MVNHLPSMRGRPYDVRMPLDALPRVPPDSRRSHLARALRDAIVRGELKPGERIVERDISARTGISRGPLREALRQLEQEGLVVSVPYQGTYVAGISQREIDEMLLPIRLVLERFAFRAAPEALGEDDYAGLEALVDEMRRAAASGDLAALVETDLRFHELVVARAGHQCLRVWRSIAPRVGAYFSRDGARHESLDEVVQEHVDLLAAMRSGDPDAILDELDRHILITNELDG